MQKIFIYCLITTFVIGCTTEISRKNKTSAEVRGVLADSAMVVSAHPLASHAGVNVLKKGGNAFDAAVAVKFALAVTYPRAGNIGGGGFAVFRKSNGESGSLDFREKAPQNASRKMYQDKRGEVIEGLSTEGQLASGVPGSVEGMVELHKKFGTLPFKDLLQPAIDMAYKGVVLTKNEAEKLNDYREAFIGKNTYNTPVVQEEIWQEGDILFQPALGATLERIRDHGRDGFYKGETAALIVKEMQKTNGIITLEDLAGYHAVWRIPVIDHYKNYKVISMPPPSSGGVALVALLKGIEPYDIKSWGVNSVNTVHIMTELERRVYADRATYLGDPDFSEVPIKMLLDSNYLAQRNATISMKHKTPSEEIKEGKVEVIESIETTHFSILDKEGNAVAITTTLNGNYGSKVMVEGAGFFLNNEMDDFSIKPGHPNQFGLVGGEANAIQPEKRMLSSMTPTILEKNGKIFMILGTNGGATIITSIFQAILNVTDHDMTMQEAVNAKRLHHQWLPDKIVVENDALDEKTIEGLKALGHELEFRGTFGKVNAILVMPDGTIEGAADITRGDDIAVGY